MRTIGLIVKTEPVKDAPKIEKNVGKKTKSESKKRVNSSDNPAS